MDLPVNQNQFKCLRCGQCCMIVGRTFWRNGDFTDYPDLQKLADETESIYDGLPCQMLQMIDGIATCKIHRDYGYDAKPEVCRKYPEIPGNCHGQTKSFKGQRICYRQQG